MSYGKNIKNTSKSNDVVKGILENGRRARFKSITDVKYIQHDQ